MSIGTHETNATFVNLNAEKLTKRRPTLPDLVQQISAGSVDIYRLVVGLNRKN